MNKRREKYHTIGNVLGFISEVFTNKSIVKSELVGKYDRLTVFLKGDRNFSVKRMQRHREVTKSHGFS
jgi:hypothetical protein